MKKERNEKFYIATKAGRRLNPHIAEGYNQKNLISFIERSLKNLETDAIDLLQLHCPPAEVFYMPEVFGTLDKLVKDGKLKYYGVSVEKVEEAIKAIEYPNVQSVQIIFNMFRQRPADLFFELAKKKQVGILARVPLSSGMLTGKFVKNSKFEEGDHRKFNRNGKAFDRGETFSVEELKAICPKGINLAQLALKWILMFDAVTCAIPGAKRKSQVEENINSSELKNLTKKTMNEVKSIYKKYIKASVHHYW